MCDEILSAAVKTLTESLTQVSDTTEIESIISDEGQTSNKQEAWANWKKRVEKGLENGIKKLGELKGKNS
ncbi:hypothetical protein [Piscirickettsia litoralis]|uniref:Uncharacterized protein n=1 Tax=Piscirickettsia litoralis TaxID=1891921 RepID=A0ABX3A8V5_9GAMM|nr:hypothetical protein [Piscirickettsia litoralis]ODN43870.1 hypothetical protein BGC07_14460 [Piscirickettsia litoralis]